MITIACISCNHTSEKAAQTAIRYNDEAVALMQWSDTVAARQEFERSLAIIQNLLKTDSSLTAHSRMVETLLLSNGYKAANEYLRAIEDTVTTPDNIQGCAHLRMLIDNTSAEVFVVGMFGDTETE